MPMKFFGRFEFFAKSVIGIVDVFDANTAANDGPKERRAVTESRPARSPNQFNPYSAWNYA